MLLRAIGELLPEALAVALSPFPVIATVLLLGAERGRRNGPAFAIGWVVGLTALTTAIVLFTNGTDDADGTASMLVNWLRVVIGALMIVLAVKTWRTRPRGDEQPEMPGWMAALNTASTLKSLLIGLGLSGLNVKNVAFTISAAAFITDYSLTGDEALVASIVFVVLASSSVIALVAFGLLGGSRADASLESVKQFMLANHAVIMMVVLLLLGGKILGRGLGGLAS